MNHYLVKNVSFLRSLPARGVWIEIEVRQHARGREESLPARGVWIEMTTVLNFSDLVEGRSPQGECGLKFQELAEVFKVFLVAPRKGSVD